MKNITILIFIILFLSPAFLSQNCYPQVLNADIKTYPVDGDDFWDDLSVDDSTNRVFISHGTQAQIIDASNGKLLGTIPDTKGIHGIAIANDMNMGFTSNGRDSSVTVFNLTTYEIITKISIDAKNPDAIIYDPFSKKVFTFNGGSSNSTVIDAKSMQVIGTIRLDGKPEFAVTNLSGKVYVNIEDKSEITEINSSTLQVEHVWSIAPCEEPSGLAIDNENHRLFAVCGNKLMAIVDADDGHVITTLPIGERVDGVAFDNSLKRAYSSNGEGTITVVQEVNKDSFKVLDNITTQKGARTIRISQKTHHLYLPTAEFEPPPEPTPENPHPRPTIKAATFVILDVEPK